MSLWHICRIRVPAGVIDETIEHLREMGTHCMEGFSLWAGTSHGEVFDVTHNVIPAQCGRITKDGVCVIVGAEELHRLNVWLYQNGTQLIAQIHSHPGEAYHSETDDTFAIVTTHGGFSLVVPNFARDVFRFSQSAIYRLSGNGVWEGVSRQQTDSIFQLY